MSESEDEQEYGLLVSFPDQSASFVHGYEAGQIGYRMQFTAEQVIEETVHAENEEVLRRMGNAYDWDVEFSDTFPAMEEWRVAKFNRRPQRNHLSVVK